MEPPLTPPTVTPGLPEPMPPPAAKVLSIEERLQDLDRQVDEMIETNAVTTAENARLREENLQLTASLKASALAGAAPIPEEAPSWKESQAAFNAAHDDRDIPKTMMNLRKMVMGKPEAPVPVVNEDWSLRGKLSQTEFNRLVDAGKLPDGHKHAIVDSDFGTLLD